MKLGIIVGTVREGRESIKQAKWVMKTAQAIEEVEVALIDLADYPMPFFAEPISPRYNPNRTPTPEVQKWLDILMQQTAIIVVTPEYNHSIPGVLKNAFDYLDFQLKRKPSAIVSHGTVGGARAAMHLKEILSEAMSVPIQNHVSMLGLGQILDEEGNLSETAKANPYGPQSALDNLLAELKWYSDALSTASSAKV